MKKVVDVNFLRHPTLDDYLGKDSRNHVVLTDYACMECYKGNVLENIRRSLEIVAKYPKQVIVLKGTCAIIRLQANGHQAPANFVDSQQTGTFRDFCRHVRSALQDDMELRSQLLNLGKMANAHFKQMAFLEKRRNFGR